MQTLASDSTWEPSSFRAICSLNAAWGSSATTKNGMYSPLKKGISPYEATSAITGVKSLPVHFTRSKSCLMEIKRLPQIESLPAS